MPYLLQSKQRYYGYTTLELLLSISIISTLLLIVSPMFKTLLELNQNLDFDYQDEVGIYQLQVELAKNKIIEFDSEQIVYLSSKSERTISLVNNNLISQPGYLCYLRKIDYIYFYKSFGIYYLEYSRDDADYCYPIGYE